MMYEMKNMKIPRVIHYCWFGKSQKPAIFYKCLKSWEKYCPDYEIKEWNEDNFDINISSYASQAYKEKKWAFVSDVARLYVLYTYGGIYLDIDVEMIRSIEDIVDTCDAFGGYELKCEEKNFINTGLILGSVPKHPWILCMLNYYKDINFIKEDGTYNLLACTYHNTNATKKFFDLKPDGKSVQLPYNTYIYSSEYFCPKSYSTGKVEITKNTYTIHHYNASWLTDEEKRQIKLKKYMGRRIYNIYYFFNKFGIIGGLKKILRKMYITINGK